MTKVCGVLGAASERGGREALKSLWASDSEWLSPFLEMVSAMHGAAGDIHHSDLRITNWRGDPPEAEITAQFQWRWEGAGGGWTGHGIGWGVRFVQGRRTRAAFSSPSSLD